MNAEAAEETKGPGIVLQPEEGHSYWQPDLGERLLDRQAEPQTRWSR